MASRQGRRCYGFQSEDGRLLFCTREEYSFQLERPVGNGDLWLHKAAGTCRCGHQHGTWAPQWSVPAPSPVRQKKSAETVARLWERASTIPGAAHVAYLRNRRLNPLALPPTLRFYDSLERWERGNSESFPAMVGQILDKSSDPPEQIGIHRTYLQKHGTKAPGTARKTLGSVTGACIPLGDAVAGRIGITEGIETGLSVQQTTGLRCWAAISASGMISLELPESIHDIVIFAEPDPAGESAATKAAQRWTDEGRSVRLARSAEGDANDILMLRGGAGVRTMLAKSQPYCN